MQHSSLWIIAAAVAALSMIGCGPPSASKPKAVAVKPPAESGPRHIKLTETQVKYLGIKFTEVKQNGDRLVTSYNTLLYDPSGGEWVFASSEPNVFVRTEVKVDSIKGEQVFLARGPAAGTKLVTDGAAELYGIEFGVGK